MNQSYNVQQSYMHNSGPLRESRRQFQEPPLPHGYNQQPDNTTSQYFPPPPFPKTTFDPPELYIPPPPPPKEHYQPPPPPTPKVRTERFIDWCLYFLPFLFAIVVIFIAVNILYAHPAPSSKVLEADQVLQTLATNLLQPPVIGITNAPPQSHSTRSLRHFQQVHDQTVCPPGSYLASLGTWPGIHAGCICDDGSIQSLASCLTKSNCHRVPEMEPSEFKFWKNQQFCIKRAENWKWIATTQDCPVGFKKCSSNICIDPADSCPITNIVKSQGTVPANTAKVKIGNDDYLLNIGAGQPLIGFSITPGSTLTNAPCFENDLAPQFESGEFYPLQNQPAKGCGSYGMQQNYATTLDRDAVKNVHSLNQLQLPDVPLYSRYVLDSDTYLLQTLKRFELGSSEECLTLPPNEVKSILGQAFSIHGYTRAVYIICVALSILIIILLPILFALKNKKTFDLCNFHLQSQLKIFLTIGVLIAVLMIIVGIVFAMQIKSENGLETLHSKLKRQLSNSCYPDESIQDAIRVLDQYTFMSYNNPSFWISLALLISLFFLVLVITLILVKHLSYNQPWCADPWYQI